MKQSTIYILALCSFIPFSCYHSKELLEPIEVLTSNKWILCGIKEETVYMRDFEKGTPYLRFETGGKLMIFTGCNFINGTFLLDGSHLKMNFTNINNPCKSYLVSDFLSGLKLSNKFKTKVERLVLVYNNTELMSFFPK